MATLKILTVGSARVPSLRRLTQEQLADTRTFAPAICKTPSRARAVAPIVLWPVKEGGELRLECAAWRNLAALIDEWHQRSKSSQCGIPAATTCPWIEQTRTTSASDQ